MAKHTSHNELDVDDLVSSHIKQIHLDATLWPHPTIVAAISGMNEIEEQRERERERER